MTKHLFVAALFAMTLSYWAGPISTPVAVLIDESGKVARAKAVCGGTDVLIDASLESALAARFTPTILNNKPIQVTGVITYNFVIQ